MNARNKFLFVSSLWFALFAPLATQAQAPRGDPVSVPVKIWVVGDVMTGSGGEPWYMSLDGSTFLPTYPGGLSPDSAYVSNADQPEVMQDNMVVTLNTVPCEPFRDYDVQFEGLGFWSGKFCVAAPPGYHVEIDSQPRGSMLFYNGSGGGSVVFSYAPRIRVIPDAAGPVKPAGISTSFRTGLLDWRVSLGALKDGSSAGEMALRGPGWGSQLKDFWFWDLTGPVTPEVKFGSYWDGASWRLFYFSNETTVVVVPTGALAICVFTCRTRSASLRHPIRPPVRSVSRVIHLLSIHSKSRPTRR